MWPLMREDREFRKQVKLHDESEEKGFDRNV
jgi:hypothetical protein